MNRLDVFLFRQQEALRLVSDDGYNGDYGSDDDNGDGDDSDGDEIIKNT